LPTDCFDGSWRGNVNLKEGRVSHVETSAERGSAMNIELRQPERGSRARVGIFDCDIHPKNSVDDLRPYLSNRWWDYLQTYGQRQRHGLIKGYPYPKSQPLACRRDSWPPGGGLPASDLDFMREQHLDLSGIEWGVMNPLSPSGQGDQNDELSAAMAHATNEYQLDHWNRREPRLLASVVVPYENAELSVKEIRARAGDRRFAHVLFLSRTNELLGKRRYWPIFEAAVEAGLAVGVHVINSSGRPMSNTGWPSFYIEEITEHSAAVQASVASLIVEGVFEHLPDLKIVLIEAGFAWIPALGWRLDKTWKRMKDEAPHLRKAPSEYLREHFWVSTQPMEETEEPQQVIDIMQWIGWDRILFASDYPHWDFDDPFASLPPSLSEERRNQIYSGNAKAVYRMA
jgi:predicted TIM-barrel fold metal-dependent hydrolase